VSQQDGEDLSLCGLSTFFISLKLMASAMGNHWKQNCHGESWETKLSWGIVGNKIG
jgi:hypothetical protein